MVPCEEMSRDESSRGRGWNDRAAGRYRAAVKIGLAVRQSDERCRCDSGLTRCLEDFGGTRGRLRDWQSGAGCRCL